MELGDLSICVDGDTVRLGDFYFLLWGLVFGALEKGSFACLLVLALEKPQMFLACLCMLVLDEIMQ